MRSIFRALCLIAILSPCSAWAVVTDAFTGTDNMDLPTYSGNWSNLFESAIGSLYIETNAVNTNTVGPGAAHYTGRTWANDQYSQATIVNTLAAAGANLVLVRADNANPASRNAYAAGTNAETTGHGRYIIGKWVSNTWTTLATHGSQSSAASDIVKLEVIGTSLKLYVNSSEILSTTDSSLSSGNAGLYIIGLSATTPYLDSFEGDDISSTPTTFFRRRIQP